MTATVSKFFVGLGGGDELLSKPNCILQRLNLLSNYK
jgi:hypothetical protein